MSIHISINTYANFAVSMNIVIRVSNSVSVSTNISLVICI